MGTERYGSDVEMRIGIMADLNTDPTAWQNLEFMSATFTPTQARQERPKIGAPIRENPLDPIKPRDGFLTGAASFVLDGDTRQLPLWLQALLGAPVSETGESSPYTHVWETGKKDQIYACIQIGGTDDDIRIYRGVVLATLAAQFTGQNVENFDLNLGARWLSRERVADWLEGDVTAVPTEAPISRVLYKVNGTAAANCLSGSWSYDRKIQEDAFLSSTPTLSGLRPGANTGLTGSATFRDDANSFEVLQEDETVFASKFAFLGAVTDHEIDLEFPQCMLNAIPVDVKNPDLIERTVNFLGHQTDANPGGRITVVNDVATYALS